MKDLSNKFAALSLAVTDATLSGDATLAPTAVAALITAANNPPASIGEMAAIVGLTHSATVRLIDRMEADGLLHRCRRVGREVLVEITPAGRRRADGLQDHRLAESKGFLTCLSPEERDLLGQLVDRMLRAHAARGRDQRRLCRMCARSNCTCCFETDDLKTKNVSSNGSASIDEI
ncbi:MarR family transcriptional regulator [Pleomorphomonas sp. JP5]|uniref:MarR family winged helix-turn-helix transcriptional regulator n=1 Tax=Pleomorphomonas sp. JP5 TaxID=2942998 RepID=UPI00204326AB|nr:MarR family transcriptional regulator [Pleomorphomonas sp. JP5]MCM5557985.1 MarR family transcriptional regulator [Pleomorphomonas sp. JP5]